MAGKKDIVEQALKLIAGSSDDAANRIASIRRSEPFPADYIEPGSVRYRYEHPDTSSFMEIITRPKGARSASVIGLEVPEEYRGTGIGKALQERVLQDYPSLMGQVSSKAAAVNAYKAGRRPLANPNATLEDVFKMIDEDSSVNLATEKNIGGSIRQGYQTKGRVVGDIVEQALKLIAGSEPQKTVKAYKLFRQKEGKLYPLFVDANEEVALGEWLKAKAGEQTASGKVKSKLGEVAYRPGWHAGDLPIATHIGARSHGDPKLPPDTRPSNQVWAEIEMADDVDWQKVANERARITKKGTPDPKTAHITDQVPFGGYYRYKTNPNMTGNWMIGGDMRVNRILTDDEVKTINEAAGVSDLPRRQGYATQGAVQPDPVFMEDAKGNRYDMAGNILPPPDNAIPDALSIARREVDPYAEEIASAKKMLADQAYQSQSWSDWAGDVGKNLYETGMSFLPTALGGRGEVGLSDLAKGAYESAKSGVTLPGDVLAGKTKVYDPVSGGLTDEVLSRGQDFTGMLTLGAGAIPAEANTLRMGMKGPAGPEDAEAAALKAAQEATEGDQAGVAATLARQPAEEPSVPPPEGIAAPSNALQTERGQRTVISPTSIKLTPQEQAVVNTFKSKADRAVVAARIRETKARYPKSDGWAPFEAVGAEFDDKGNPVIKWKEQTYGFNTAVQPGNRTVVDPVTGAKSMMEVNEPRALRPGTPQYEAQARKATRNGVNEVEDIIRRAGEGDENALRIIRQAGWYREFMRKGFDERGGSYPAFSDLLGATSPNTAVDQNYRYSVDLQNRFARGDFDEPVKFASEYQGSLNAFPEEKLIYRDPVGPKGPQKLQYGMNSRNAQMALADKWRTKEPGQAPKARNFSGNLGGATDQATIDVWAARFINRMAGRKRLPPPVESGVKGKLGSNLEPTGEFGFGQDVFRRITDELNRRGNLKPYLKELGYDSLTPMDMQALTWFIEKERWTKNNWTTAAGEGGSFEDELLKYPSERWQSGVSIQQSEPPSDVAMGATRNVFENSLKGDPNVNQFRVHPTIGRYAGNNERSFDLELTAKPGWDPRTWMAAVIREAQANNQYDVFFSKRLAPEMAQTNPNARPGVEIYFRDRKTLDEALPILEEFTKRNADGFTFVTDLRLRERELGGKEAPDFVGVRMQWVPEIRMRWDDEFRDAVAADPSVLDTEKRSALNSMQDALDALDKAGLGVVDARVHHYDTLTVGKESYDKFLDGIASPDNAAGRYEGGSGAAVDPVKRFGQPIYSHVEGRNRALRAGSEGGAADTGGDVVGAGEPSGPLTPEERAANLQSTFGQTYLKDPQGNPMRLYHLTPQDITEFSASPQNRSGPVVFLSPYKDFQPAYHQAGIMGPRGEFTQEFREGANVMPVYADVRNPLVLDHPRKIKEAAAKYQGGDREFPRYISPQAKAAMEADGFDGIIYGGDNPIPYGTRPQDARLGFQEGGDEEIIVFDPKRIKSAVSNKGTYDTSSPDITKALGGLVDDEDIDNAIRIARATGGRAGYAEAGPVFMEDAKGNKYDAQGKIIPPTNTGPNPQRGVDSPEAVGTRAAQDPATFDAIMERYAVPDRDIAEYEALKSTVAKQPQDVQQMTHVGDRPRRDVSVDMPLLGGEYKMGTAPYDVAGPMSGMAQTAYDWKTAPFYALPATAPFAMAADTAEGVATGDPLSASLAIGFGPGGKYAKAAGIGAVNYLMAPDEAEAGPERWFSKAMQVARELPMEKMTGQQALAMLRKGVSPEELKWTGADTFLPQQKQITKQDLVDYLAKNRVQTKDVVFGGSKPIKRDYVKPTPTASAPYMDEWNALVTEGRELDRRVREAVDAGNDDLADAIGGVWVINQAKMDALHSKMVDATIKEMGGLGEPLRYGPGSSYGEKYVTPGGADYRETLITLPTSEYGKLYQSGHWQDVPNVVGHIRTQVLDVMSPGANRPYKAFNVDEAQSDYAKAGREKGFGISKEEYEKVEMQALISRERLLQHYENLPDRHRPTNEEIQSDISRMINGRLPIFIDPEGSAEPLVDAFMNDYKLLEKAANAIPTAPYVTSTQNWTDLSIKKALDQAMDAGADYFTYTPGEAQAKRYSLRNEVQGLAYDPEEKTLSFYPKDGRGWQDVPDTVPREDLKKYVGEEAAKKLLAQEPNALSGNHILEGIDLEFGGEGMIDYYNNIYKKRVEKVVKDATGKKVQWEVIPVQAADGPREQLGFRLTDDMKEARFSDFNKGGRVTDPIVDKALSLTAGM